MTTKNKNKTRARELQALTGASYQSCLNLVKQYPTRDARDLVALLPDNELFEAVPIPRRGDGAS